MPTSDPSFIPKTAWVDSSATTIRVRFSLKPLVNAALTTAANYTVAGNTVSAAATVADDPYAVKLTLGTAIDLKTPALITIAAGVIFDASNTYQIAAPGNTVSITAPGQAARKQATISPKYGLKLGALPPIVGGTFAAKVTTKPKPTLAVSSPAVGSTVAASDAITVQAVAVGGLVLVAVAVTFDDTSLPVERIYGADGLTAGYNTSTITAIPNGTQIAIRRNLGWPSGFTFSASLVDGVGQLVTLAAHFNATAIGAPTVSNLTPALTASILPTDTIGFDLAFGAPLRDLIFSVEYAKLKTSELVYRDGAALPAFVVTVTTIGGGLRFSIKRVDGWPASPSLVVKAIDILGRENP